MGFFDKLFGGGAAGDGAAGGRSEIVITSNEVAVQGFTETTFREGYDSEQVAETLNHAVATLDAYERGEVPAGPITAKQVVNVRFAQTKFRNGWDQDEVDDLLDRVAVTLRYFEGQA